MLFLCSPPTQEQWVRSFLAISRSFSLSLYLSLKWQRDLLLNTQSFPFLERAMLSSQRRDSYSYSSCSKGEDNLSLSLSKDNYSTILSVQRERHPYPCQDTAGHELSLPLNTAWIHTSSLWCRQLSIPLLSKQGETVSFPLSWESYASAPSVQGGEQISLLVYKQQ